MFEPENQIESDLMRAAAEPAARPAFARAILDAQVFVVLIPEGASIVPGPDGSATIPEGTKLKLAGAERDGHQVVPFFTAPSRARVWCEGDHIVAPEKTRDLFARIPGTPFVLNPGSDYGKEFTPSEIERMLAGEFEDGPRTIVTDKPMQVLLAHPAQKPDALIAALKRELGAVKTVSGAWLMLAMHAGAADQSWMLGVDHKGDWAEVSAAIDRAVKDDVLQGRMLDTLPLEDTELASTLRTGIPIVAKRGFFSFFR